jgi:hypothetical protein
MQAKCCCPTNYTYMAAYKAHRTMCRAQAWLAEVSKSGDGCESTAISSPLLRLGLLQLWLLLGLLVSAASLLECPARNCTYASHKPPYDTKALYCWYSDASVNTTGKHVEVHNTEAATSLHVARLSFIRKVSEVTMCTCCMTQALRCVCSRCTFCMQQACACVCSRCTYCTGKLLHVCKHSSEARLIPYTFAMTA